MQLFLISQDYPPDVGGIQTYAWEIASQLSERMDELTVIAPNASSAPGVDEKLSGQTIRISTRPDLLVLPLLLRLPILAAKLKPDVSFHAQWQTAPAAILSRRLTGYPRKIAVAAHGRELLFNPLSGSMSDVYDRARRAVIRSADALLPVSCYTAGLLEDLGAERARIHVVNNGTDPDRFQPVDASQIRRDMQIEDRRVVLTVTRLVGRKGVDTVINALPRVVEQHPSLTYLIVGDGPERLRLEALARDVAPGADIRFLGRVPYDQLPAYYSAADVAVMPSRNEEPDVEGFGIVFLEANACGCPVIGTTSGGIPDAVIDGETGLLVPPDDPVALAAAISKLMYDEDMRLRLGKNGRRRVVNAATWTHAAGRVLDVLRQL
jgi:phosphatidyl-myo-inositol dimannoside synthase